VTRGIAAIHFQLGVRHDDSRAGLDMVPAQWRVIARVRDDRDVPIPIGFEYIGVIGVGTSAARNCRIVRWMPIALNRGQTKACPPATILRSYRGTSRATFCRGIPTKESGLSAWGRTEACPFGGT